MNEEQTTVTEPTYTGQDIINSKRYRQYIDLLTLLLEEDKDYCLDDVDELIKQELSKKVEL